MTYEELAEIPDGTKVRIRWLSTGQASGPYIVRRIDHHNIACLDMGGYERQIQLMTPEDEVEVCN
jgi:hypothetical protein